MRCLAQSSTDYNTVIMGAMASQITSLAIVYSTVDSRRRSKKHQSSASLAFGRGPVNSPHKRPILRKMSPFDDDIMRKRNQNDPYWYLKPHLCVFISCFLRYMNAMNYPIRFLFIISKGLKVKKSSDFSGNLGYWSRNERTQQGHCWLGHIVPNYSDQTFTL